MEKIKFVIVAVWLSAHVGFARETTEQNGAAKSVAIIGGGIAGVAAAAFLQESGHHVHLFEASDSLGGNAQTVLVNNTNGEVVAVDAGPQYFAKGGWDVYIAFLKHFGLFDKHDFIEFDTSVVISKFDEDWPILASPRMRFSHVEINLCKRNLLRLMALKELVDESRLLYEAKVPNKDLTVDQWLKQIDVSDEEKANVYLPFLASILGTSIAQTRELSALSLAHLYAFRAPSIFNGSKFTVSKFGMGELIKKIGEKLKKTSSINVETSSHVSRIKYANERYLLEANGKESQPFDAVIFATHPDDMAKTINNHTLAKQLNSLPYISARIVLHEDRTRNFINPEYPAHFNIVLNEQGEVMTTMNLEEINEKRFKGILKSWVDSDEVFYLMGGILKTIVFKHPLMTPHFLKTVDIIKDNLAHNIYGLGSGIAIAGGWTQVHETQNSAILSAFQAVLRLDLLSELEIRLWNDRFKNTGNL